MVKAKALGRIIPPEGFCFKVFKFYNSSNLASISEKSECESANSS